MNKTSTRNFFKGFSDSLPLMGYHPKKSLTWYWHLAWNKNRPGFRKDWFKIIMHSKELRKGQWHHRLYLFGKGYFILGFQDWHKYRIQAVSE